MMFSWGERIWEVVHPYKTENVAPTGTYRVHTRGRTRGGRLGARFVGSGTGAWIASTWCPRVACKETKSDMPRDGAVQMVERQYHLQ